MSHSKSHKAVIFLILMVISHLSAFAGERDDWNIVISRVFKEIHDMDTFAFAVPLYRNQEKFISLAKKQADTNEMLLNSDYVLVYTPHKSKVNNVWYLLEVDRITGSAAVIGRGGEIEYLKSDIFDAPGFNENDRRRCEKTSLFPQRRIQSCKQVDCKMTLYLNGQGNSPDYTYLFGTNGWHLLQSTKSATEATSCLFDSGKASYLLNIGKDPESPTR